MYAIGVCSRRKRIKRLSVAFLFVFLLFFCATASSTVILIYHKVGDNRTPSTNVSVRLFKKQMEYLKSHHYSVISLKRLVGLLEKKKPLPEKSVVITFDDGYRSIYENAFPIIKKYGYPITVFLPTEAIEKHYPDYLTMDQIKKMRNYGVDFESHSYAHHHMAFIPKGYTIKQYENWVKSDLEKSIRFFKNNFGYKPSFFAIPYGEYNKILLNVARKIGFKAILTQDPGAVNRYTSVYLLPREPILGRDWSTMKHFKMILNREYLPLKDRTPPIGFLKQTPTVIGAELLFPKRYKNCGIYVSELGWKKALRRGNFFYIKNSKPLLRKKDRIALTCWDKRDSKVAVNFWMVINAR